MTRDFLVDGAGGATQLLLAHGAGAPMDHPWMSAVASRFAAAGVEVVRFEFPYMAGRRSGQRKGPDPERVLRKSWLDVIAERRDQRPLFLGGKSMGGRYATMICDEASVAGVVCFGYPFHPPGDAAKLRVAHLRTLATPVMILQGERDPFGGAGEVPGYELPPVVELRWIRDGDHSLSPRSRSGLTLDGNLDEAASAAIEFMSRRR